MEWKLSKHRTELNHGHKKSTEDEISSEAAAVSIFEGSSFLLISFETFLPGNGES